MQGAFVVPAEARLRDVVTDKDGRFLWNEAAIAFGAASSLTGLRSTDNITVDGSRAAVGAVPRSAARRSRPAAAPRWCSRTRRSRRRRRRRARAVQVDASACAAPARSRCSSPARNWPRRSARPGRRPSFNGNTLPLNSTVSADGFEANWQTMEFGSPRIATSPAHHRSGDVERRDHRRRPDRGDADLPHDQSRREIRAAVRGAVVRDLFLLRGAVAAAHPHRAVRAARPLALAVLAAAALARRADRLHHRLSGRAPGSCWRNPRSTPRRSRGASCRRSCSP